AGAVAADVGRGAGGDRHHRRLRRPRLRAGGRGGRPAARAGRGGSGPILGRVSFRRESLPPMDVVDRSARLRARLAEAGCDALLVTNVTNIRYLTRSEERRVGKVGR